MKYRLLKSFSILLPVVVLTTLSGAIEARPTLPFDVATEFPNLLLPQQYRGSAPEAIPKEVIATQRAALEKAVASIMDRITVPLINESGELIEPKYFAYLLERVQKIDRAVEIIPSGGVVRSALSYVYDELRKGKTLESIALETRPIPASEFRSIGGDFDVFARSPNGKQAQIAKLIKDITNSAEEFYGMAESRATVKRQFFTIADVKDFDSHWNRSVAQGGSTLDFLGFHYTAVGGRFLEPPLDTEIMNNLIRGRFRYIAGNVSAEDLAKQVVRGFRALVELPWLRLADERVLAEEADQVIRAVRDRSATISQKVVEQFAKLVRNSRYHGANNRLHRADLGSVEGKLVQLSAAISEPGKPLLPEFLQVMPPGRETLPSTSYVNYDQFITKHTDNGTLHHGTPMLEHGMAILRNGLFVSAENQGASAYGFGTYTSAEPSVARGYAGAEGLVLDIRIKPSAKIIDWKRFASESPSLFAEIEANAAAAGIDPKRYFSQRYDVDVIIDRHILIQNADMVEYPDGMRSLLNSIREQAMDTARPALQRLRAAGEFRRSQSFLAALGEKVDDLQLDERSIHLAAVAEVESISRPDKYSTQRLLDEFANHYQSIPPSQRENFPIPKNLDKLMAQYAEQALQDSIEVRREFNIFAYSRLQNRLAEAGLPVRPIDFNAIKEKLESLSSRGISTEKFAKIDHSRIVALLAYVAENYPSRFEEATAVGAIFFRQSIGPLIANPIHIGRTNVLMGLSLEASARLLEQIFIEPPNLIGLGTVGSILRLHPSLASYPPVSRFIDRFIAQTGKLGQQIAIEFLLYNGTDEAYSRILKLVQAGAITQKSFPSGGSNYPPETRLKLIHFLLDNRHPGLWELLRKEVHQYLTALKTEPDSKLKSALDELARSGTRGERAYAISARAHLLPPDGQRTSLELLLAMDPPLNKEDLRFLYGLASNDPVVSEFIAATLDPATTLTHNRMVLFDNIAPYKFSDEQLPAAERFLSAALGSDDEEVVRIALDKLDRIHTPNSVTAILHFDPSRFGKALMDRHKYIVQAQAIAAIKNPELQAAAVAVLESVDMSADVRNEYNAMTASQVTRVESGSIRFGSERTKTSCYDYFWRVSAIARERELAEQIAKGASK